MQQKLWLEDLLVGQEFVSATHRLTADEIKEFAGRYDPQPFHMDEAAARGTMFGGLAASGWHTAAITMRLSVQSFPLASGIIGSGGELTWTKPVRPGDALQVKSEILEIIPSQSKPDRGMVIVKLTTTNQNGEIVQTFSPKLVVFRRPGT
ncbi:MAG: MaoC family dehydratase [Methylobacteriaceae bacterium]|nr:MaoC family dehydratase [Methylobacteriaceae bacterium]MBV9395831.1 MaoC family dehydratase [Methylobacteriaceae bacterium]